MKFLDNFFGEIDKKEVISWAFYDFANSSYALIVASFVFPIFFREQIAGPERGDFYWGLVISISVLAGGLLAPIIGAMVDYDGRRRPKFVLFALMSILGTALLYFTGSGTLLLASLIFILANLSFEIAQTLYDSFVGHVSTRETVGRISGFAWGLGYIGGVVSMLVLKPFYEAGADGANFMLTFPLTALFFLVFALPSFIFLKERSLVQLRDGFFRLVKAGFSRIGHTMKNIRQHKNVAWFLLGFYFVNDALVTIFAFMPIYARTTLNMTFKEIFVLILIVQVIAFPAAAILGWLSDKKGSKKVLLATLAGWCLVVILLTIANSKTMLYVIVFIAGIVMGSSQAIIRSWLSKIVPEDKRFEFFGFNAFASKISAIFGPIIFGAVSSFTGNQRLATLSLLPFFVIAFIIFTKIHEESYGLRSI